jgi:EmrB/QacA subfamily drug resistance transporter
MTRYRHLITDENRKWWTLGAMCFALFMIMLDNTVVNVALPSIQRDLHASISGLEWTINGYTLSFAVLLATGGRLGDIFGRRRMFLFGVVIFALSSATAGLALSSTDLVISRVVQGVGAALMMPATLSIITDAFPASERGKAMGMWAGVSALALAVGPVVGGFLTEHVSWRAIFYLNIPVAIGAIVASLFAVRESRDTTVGREVDFAGVAVLTGALTALILALVEGNEWGWGSIGIVALLIGAVVGFAAFVAIELRVKTPMVEFHFFSDRNFLGAVVVALIVSFSMLGVFFFLAIYMQDILHYSPLEAGVRFLPSTSARTSALSPTDSAAMPGQSIECSCESSRDSCVANSVTATAPTATGRLRKKMARQETYSASAPPTTGPIASARAETPAQVPIALPRSSGGKVTVMIERVAGIMKAAPMP